MILRGQDECGPREFPNEILEENEKLKEMITQKYPIQNAPHTFEKNPDDLNRLVFLGAIGAPLVVGLGSLIVIIIC